LDIDEANKTRLTLTQTALHGKVKGHGIMNVNAMPNKTIVETRGLTRVYRTGPAEIRAVDGIDLTIYQGEFLALVGVSGSGKSTLLHLIGGLDTPTSGTIRVQGRELQSLSSFERACYRRTAVGFVFQSFHLVPSMSAVGNVALALTFQGIFGMERKQRSAEALRRVGLEHRADHRPGQLSGGEQQRVAVARAIVHRPPLLLADEPTGNLDRRNAGEIMNQLREINRKHATTIVLVTHDEETAGKLADRVIRLRDGRIDGQGGTGE
jgi:putative ABC transport system ATP-binding protein